MERQSEKPNRTIEGASSTILFDAYPQLLHHAENRTGRTHYLRIEDSESLPFPTNHVELYTVWRDEDDTLPRLYGDVTFSAEDVQKFPNVWPLGMLDEIDKRLEKKGINTRQLDHDPLSLYIALNDEKFLRLAFYSDPDECGISFSTVFSDEFYQEVEAAQPGINAADMVMRAGEVISVILDELNHSYSKRKRGRQRGRPAVLNATVDIPTDAAEEPQPKVLIEKEGTPAGTVHELGTQALILYRYPVTGPSPEELQTRSQHTLEHVGGFFETKKRLQQIANVFTHPEIAARYDVAPPNFMLHGPSRVDNAELIEAFAATIEATLVPVRSTDVVDKMIGDAAKKLDAIFKKAIEDGTRQVLYFENIDLLLSRDSSSSKVYEEIEGHLVRYVSEIYAKYPHIIIAASTTKDTHSLSPELTDNPGFEQLYVPLPNEQERVDMWLALLGARRNKLDTEWIDGEYQHDVLNPIAHDYNYGNLATLSDGMHGGHMRSAIQSALLASYSEHVRSDTAQQVTQATLEQAIKNISGK